jgi:hypothetical protein
MNKEEVKGIEKLKETQDSYLKDELDYAIEAVLKLIKKQEKIIDKMAEHIKDLDLDESICIENTINPQLCNDQLSNCKECIKEYFKKEVEKECEK